MKNPWDVEDNNENSSNLNKETQKKLQEEFLKKIFENLDKEQQKLYQVCDICNIIVPYEDEIKHCNECNICIKAIDHHCYWVGKCITKNNYIAFHIFTFTILLYYVWYAIIIVVWAILEIAKRRNK